MNYLVPQLAYTIVIRQPKLTTIFYTPVMRKLAALWGIGGFIAILVVALDRLIPVTIAAFDWNFTWWHWVLLGVNTLAMAYYEGYKGFQRGYSPRVAARANYLKHQGQAVDCLLAPLFCMSFYAAPRRRRMATWILTIFITLMIVLFQYLPQPTRGILDAGVIVGLSWGLIATLYFGWLAATEALKVDPEVQHWNQASRESYRQSHDFLE